jgi:hypothetical protein
VFLYSESDDFNADFTFSGHYFIFERRFNYLHYLLETVNAVWYPVRNKKLSVWKQTGIILRISPQSEFSVLYPIDCEQNTLKEVLHCLVYVVANACRRTFNFHILNTRRVSSPERFAVSLRGT